MSPLMGIRNVFEYILDEWGIDELQGARGNGRIWPDGEPPDVYLPVDDAAGHPEAEAAVDRCLAGRQRRQGQPVLPGLLQMVLHHGAQQALAPVGGPDCDDIHTHGLHDASTRIETDRCPGETRDRLTSREARAFCGDHAQDRVVRTPVLAERGQRLCGSARIKKGVGEQIEVGGPPWVIIWGVEWKGFKLVRRYHPVHPTQQISPIISIM